MSLRLDYTAINGKAIAAMARARNAVLSIDLSLRALVELRVSQINGCSFCTDLHAREALQAGEAQQRLDRLAGWKEDQVFSASEKAALAWSEALTLIAGNDVPDTLFEELCDYFSDEQIVDLTLIISQMNAWNRLAISFGRGPEP